MIILAAFEPGIFFLLLWGLFSWLTSRKKKKKIDTDSSTVIHKPKVDIITRLQKLQDNISQEFGIFPSESKSAEDLEEYLADEFDFDEPEIVKSEEPVVIKEEIEEINEVEGEVEQVVSVAGVRGAEAEDEALQHLYYRKSMKGLSQIELQKALGKLMKKKNMVTDTLALKKINGYILSIEKKLK